MKNHSEEVKSALLEKAQQKVRSQINDIENQLSQLAQAGAEEGKSSAGDKYETQREMIKQSRDLLDIQLSRTQRMFEQLKHIPTQAQSSVQEGALLKLPIGWILVSVSLGKLEMDGKEYQFISKDSPLFLALKNKKIGENVLFRGIDLVVEGLI